MGFCTQLNHGPNGGRECNDKITWRGVTGINFVIASSDLWPHVLDTWVKGGAKLSTVHHLVMSWVK